MAHEDVKIKKSVTQDSVTKMSVIQDSVTKESVTQERNVLLKDRARLLGLVTTS